jgi:glutaminase
MTVRVESSKPFISTGHLPDAATITELITDGARPHRGDKWRFIRTGLSKFAARTLALNEDVYASASETNARNQGIRSCATTHWP